MAIGGEGHRVNIAKETDFGHMCTFSQRRVDDEPGVAAELLEGLARLEPVHPDGHVEAGGEQLAVVLAELQAGHLERDE